MSMLGCIADRGMNPLATGDFVGTGFMPGLEGPVRPDRADRGMNPLATENNVVTGFMPGSVMLGRRWRPYRGVNPLSSTAKKNHLG